MTKFVPVAKQHTVKCNLRLVFEAAEYEQVKKLAQQFNVSVNSFGKQAIQYAIERLEGGHGTDKLQKGVHSRRRRRSTGVRARQN